tara:strand:- start:73 stop:219 length:147 start_codon:yes stop_codon:yes gene_type:complete
VLEQALARLADEMVGLARHSPHPANKHAASAALQMKQLSPGAAKQRSL